MTTCRCGGKTVKVPKKKVAKKTPPKKKIQPNKGAAATKSAGKKATKAAGRAKKAGSRGAAKKGGCKCS